jgi:hypothetical protein
MITWKTDSPKLNKVVEDGFKLVATQLEVANRLKEREINTQEELLRLLRRLCRPARPEGLQHQLVRETEGMADTLTYSVKCDAPTDPDVESRKIKVEVDGTVTKEDTVGSEVTDFGTIDVAQDSNVKISIVDIDDANNESPPLVSEFVAKDTIAPGAPTGMSVVLLSEQNETIPPPPEEPPAPPEEPPAPPADPVTPPAEEPPAPPAE